ncbi:cold-regulated 413 plasma membrane protein 4 [Eucalyptus grandis]|uniref:Uncharacterized protein n=2 Tax=Eucalyptus grandis TaxID=71139 RepID=A0ACC3JIP1_EUCGR|nr:cold-regulated 413 plasma membrane protein 4 [Eucalyptus grandis]KAK3413986.1 hypothetical protein EUGRSUZ_I02482 [Eucalyptus grandis]
MDGEIGSSSGTLATFQWGGAISAIFLLIMNRTGRKSSMQTTALVLYLFTSFPTVLFKILRGEFGCWVAFLAVVGNLFFPQIFTVSRFILFVVTPDWIANGLRESMAGGIFCLVLGIILVVNEFRGMGGLADWHCNCHCFGYCLGVGFLFFFTIYYLCKGTW